MNAEHFPHVERVTDSLGNTFSGADPHDPNAFQSSVNTNTTLHVGDTLTFKCSGSDPRGRTLVWTLAHVNVDDATVTTAEGDEVELVWNIAPQHVTLRASVVIHLTAKNADYHRLGQFDEQIDWNLAAVLPPADS